MPVAVRRVGRGRPHQRPARALRPDDSRLSPLLGDPALTTFFLAITGLGSIEAVAAVGAIVAAILAWRRRWILLGTWLAAVGGSAVLDRLLKGIFARSVPSSSTPCRSRRRILSPADTRWSPSSSTGCWPTSP